MTGLSFKTSAAAIVMAAALSSCGQGENPAPSYEGDYKLSWFGGDTVLAQWDVKALTRESPLQVGLGENGPPGSPQISGVTCDRQPVDLDIEGRWTLPLGCQRLKWNIQLEDAATADAATQRSFFDRENGWLVISDLYSLLRPVGVPFAVNLNINLVQGFSWCEAIPDQPGLCHWNADGPPDFFAWSDQFRVGKLADGSLSVLHLAMAGEADKLDLAEFHAEGLKYLIDATDADNRALWQKLLPAELDLFSEPMKVVELPKCLDGEVNAATGERLIILSSPCQQSEGARLRVLTTLLHESFHYLTQGASMPLWAGESLASYYSITAMSRVTSGQDAQQLYEGYLAFGRQPGYGLLRAQSMVQSGEDPAAYSQLYFQGAAFWADVEGFAQAHGKSLDTFLPLLLTSDWGLDGGLPVTFDAQMRGLDEAAWQALIERHL